MAIYIGTKSMLAAALGKYHTRGFSLVMTVEQTLLLYYMDALVMTFTRDSIQATIPRIHATCQAYLESMRG